MRPFAPATRRKAPVSSLRTRAEGRSASGRVRLVLGILIAVCLLVSGSAAAQQVKRLAGRVTRPDGSPAVRARVQITTDGAQTIETFTDSAGMYQAWVSSGSRAWVVSVEATGLRPATRMVESRAGPGSVTATDVQLELEPVALRPLVVRVPRLSVEAATRWTPGSVERSSLGIDLRREPLAGNDVTDVAARQVGVAESAGPDGPGLSIAGQPPDQTRLTMDGATASSGLVPREALQSVNVLTNTYDVARGQFTGGQVDVRTQRGGNAWGATLRVDGREPWLQYGDAPALLQRRTRQLGADGGFGGALLRDRLFVFGALTLRRAVSPALSVANLGPPALGSLGIESDSVARFLQLSSAFWPRSEPSREESRAAVGLVRLDAVVSPSHTLMLRVNGQNSRISDDGSVWAVPGTGTVMRGSNLGFLAQLSSGRARIANDLKFHVTRSRRDWAVADDAPTGVVEIASGEVGGGTSYTPLRFAGSPVSASDTRQHGLRVQDELVLVTRDRRHRLRVGGEAAVEEQRWTPQVNSGSFTFASLADLERNTPSVFTRSTDTRERTVDASRTALFADDHWRMGRVELSYGARAERWWYSASGEVDPAVAASFGLTPGRIPSRWEVSPRIGFAWTTRMPWDSAGSSTEIQGGIGQFVGELPLSALGLALGQTGAPDAQDLVCIGASAPVPDWAAYRADPSSVPASCVDGAPQFASRLRRATIFAPGSAAPRVLRASVGAQGLLPSGVFWNVTASLLRGLRQPVAFDRNLDHEPAFTNAAEGGRPVYAEAEAIDPATGSVSLGASRRLPEFGIVREVSGRGRSQTLQLGGQATKVYFRLRAGFGYTWTRSRQEVGAVAAPAGALASTAGDPWILEWAPAAYTPRHVLNLNASWRTTTWLSLGMVGRLSSGTPYTPMVAGDVNGDGLQNDRAFVFGAASGSGVDVERLASDAPAHARRCLRAQIGRVAAPNSCWTGWSPSLDLNARIQLGPKVEGPAYSRLTFWIVARNVTAGLDYMLHGSDDLRGWGQVVSVDNTLLTVRGFDPGQRQFRYEANPRFGSVAQSGLLNRVPFALSIEGRIAIGSDRVVSAFRQNLRAANERGQSLMPESLRAYLAQQMVNVPAQVLMLNAPRRLLLTPAQAARLQAAADSIGAENRTVEDALVTAVLEARAGTHSHAENLRVLSRRAVLLRQLGADLVRTVLSPEQWQKLPGQLRSPGAEFAPFPPEQITVQTGF